MHSYLSLKPAIWTLASWGQVSWVTVLYAKTNLPTIPMAVAVTSLLTIHSFTIWTNLWSTKSIHNIFTLILDLRKVSSCNFHSNFTQSYPTIMTNIFIRWIFTATWASTGIIIHLLIHRPDYFSVLSGSSFFTSLVVATDCFSDSLFFILYSHLYVIYIRVLGFIES